MWGQLSGHIKENYMLWRLKVTLIRFESKQIGQVLKGNSEEPIQFSYDQSREQIQSFNRTVESLGLSKPSFNQ